MSEYRAVRDILYNRPYRLPRLDRMYLSGGRYKEQSTRNMYRSYSSPCKRHPGFHRGREYGNKVAYGLWNRYRSNFSFISYYQPSSLMPILENILPRGRVRLTPGFDIKRYRLGGWDGEVWSDCLEVKWPQSESLYEVIEDTRKGISNALEERTYEDN